MSSDPSPDPDRLQSKRDNSNDPGDPDSAASSGNEGEAKEQQQLTDRNEDPPGDRPESETDEVSDAAENTVEELAEETESEMLSEVNTGSGVDGPEGPAGPEGPGGTVGGGAGADPEIAPLVDDGSDLSSENMDLLKEVVNDAQPTTVETDDAGRIRGDPWEERSPVPPEQRMSVSEYQQSLSEGITSSEYTSGDQPRSASLEAGEDQYGSWNEYRRSQVDETVPLTATDAAQGQSAEDMYVHKFGDDADADRAFVTEVDPTDGGQRNRVQRTMATHIALDHLGLKTPRHVYDSYNNEAVVESVGESPEDAIDIAEADAFQRTDRLQQINRQDYIDLVAANMVAGNSDLHEENLKVGPDGELHTFDYDRGGNIGPMKEIVAQNASNLAATYISPHRDDDELVVEPDTILERAKEIAQQAEESGRADEIVETLSEYDNDVFAGTDTSASQEFKKNLTHFSQL